MQVDVVYPRMYVNPNPVISISDDAICEGATANIIGPSGFAIYN